MIWRRKDPEPTIATRNYLLERIALDSIEERRRARRWGIFFKLLTACYGLFISTAIFWRGMGTGLETDSHTAVVTLEGQIAADSDASAAVVIEGLRHAFEAPGTKGVVLHINSPGGSAVQSSYIYDEILRLRAEYPGVPIHTVIGDLCASGGYYAAAATENIYANRASLVGSIGVIMGGFGFVDTMRKLGIERRLITAGENKAMLDPFAPLDEGAVEHARGMVAQIHEQFISAVKAGRGERLQETKDLYSGLVWTGEQALEIGLVDGLSTVTAVARDIIKEENIIEYGPRESILDQLSKEIGVSLQRWLDGIVTRLVWSSPA